MTEPNPSRPLTDAEIERRLAELEASIAQEKPPAPAALPPDPIASEPSPEVIRETTTARPRPPRPTSQREFEPAAAATSSRSSSTSRTSRTGAAPALSTVSDALASSPIVARAVGIARFSRRSYEEVARDGFATVQAAQVVLLVAIVSGIGGLGAGLGGFFTGVLWALIKWGLFTVSAWFVATRVFDTKPDHDVTALGRVLGFAQFPGILAIVGFIPILGWSISAVGNLWIVLAVLMGLRYILKLDFRQAFLTSLGAWLVSTLLAVMIALLFGVNLGHIF